MGTPGHQRPGRGGSRRRGLVLAATVMLCASALTFLLPWWRADRDPVAVGRPSAATELSGLDVAGPAATVVLVITALVVVGVVLLAADSRWLRTILSALVVAGAVTATTAGAAGRVSVGSNRPVAVDGRRCGAGVGGRRGPGRAATAVPAAPGRARGWR